MITEKPLKIMYLNPLASSASYDPIFANMAREHKLPQTEVHVASLPESVGGFTHIEFRAYEAMVTRGIIRAVRAAAREGFDALAIGCFYDTALHDAREISASLSQAVGDTTRVPVIDVRKATFMDSMVLAVLAHAGEQLRNQGRGLTLAIVDGPVRDLLDTSGLADRFELVSDLPETAPGSTQNPAAAA